MTEVDQLARLLGVPGVLLGLGIWAVRTLAPIWREHLKESRKLLDTNNTLIQSVTKAMETLTYGILEWHKLHDIRLADVERQVGETGDDVLNLYNILNRDRPARRRRTDQPLNQPTTREAKP